MRWPRLWRRRSAVHDRVEMPGYRPGSWAEVSLPPVQSSAQSARALDEPSQPPPAAQVLDEVIGQVKGGVRLGFADGTSVSLDEESAESETFRTIAGSLALKDEPREQK